MFPFFCFIETKFVTEFLSIVSILVVDSRLASLPLTLQADTSGHLQSEKAQRPSLAPDAHLHLRERISPSHQHLQVSRKTSCPGCMCEASRPSAYTVVLFRRTRDQCSVYKAEPSAKACASQVTSCCASHLQMCTYKHHTFLEYQNTAYRKSCERESTFTTKRSESTQLWHTAPRKSCRTVASSQSGPSRVQHQADRRRPCEGSSLRILHAGLEGCLHKASLRGGDCQAVADMQEDESRGVLMLL